MEQVMEQLYKQRHNENNQVVLKDIRLYIMLFIVTWKETIGF